MSGTSTWRDQSLAAQKLFSMPIMTTSESGSNCISLRVQRLDEVLNRFDSGGLVVEHIYNTENDY